MRDMRKKWASLVLLARTPVTLKLSYWEGTDMAPIAHYFPGTPGVPSPTLMA